MKRSLLIFVACLLCIACGRRSTVDVENILPRPGSVEVRSGGYELPENITVAFTDKSLGHALYFLSTSLSVSSCTAGEGDKGDIVLALDESLDETGAYTLSVSRRGIRITGGSYGGVIAGIATLRQLMPADGTRLLPAVYIDDAPRFAWRGFHLDVSRHFFTVDEVMSLIERAAQYKFNKFHWHLTDDQGWRIEIKRYPELTAHGAWRDPATHKHDIGCLKRAEEDDDATMLLPEKNLREIGGKKLYGGYYTQDEIRQVVAFAADLGIDVIPELDMPGHSLSILSSHPEFSCTGKPEWGKVFTSPLCLGNDSVIEFAKNVYSEVFELFPFGYVHLGADEVEKDNWKKCPKCRKRITDNGLSDEYELQAWFVGHMERFFNDNGRHLIGWDEITRGGLSEDAVVQWWRSWMPNTLEAALDNGNMVLLSPSEFTYLNSEQNRNTMLKVYNYEPAIGVAAGRDRQMLGLHSCLWTEYIPSFDRACHQLFPRFFAVSEIAWSRPEYKDPSAFVRRAMAHLQRLDADGWNYRIPDLDGFCDINVFIESATVGVAKPFEGIEVRYTLDGSIPDHTSELYTEPLTISSDCTLRLRSYTASGKAGETVTAVYKKTSMRDAVAVDSDLNDGLSVKWYGYKGEACCEIETAPLNGEYITDGVYIPEEAKGNIGLVFTGYIEIPEDGIYSFYTYSDDGSMMYIDGQVVVDNDGPHSRRERSAQIALRAGLHPVELRYFDSNGGILEAGTIDAGGRRIPFAPGMFRH